MKQARFEDQHQATWQRFTAQLERLERNARQVPGSETFGRDYRHVCQHLALARARGYSRLLVDSLQQLARRGHQQFYRQRSNRLAQLAYFILAGFPRRVRAEWRFLAVSATLFCASLLGMGLLVHAVPELIYSVTSPEQVEDLRAMYDPAASRIGMARERASSEDWMMFGYYIMNNVGIALQTYASGLPLGLGSLFFLLYNGLLIGAVAGYLTQIGHGQVFWPFVVGHGAFELTGIVLAGAAGLKLGWSLLAPGQLSRAHALRVAARHGVHLMSGVMLMLLAAAFIEAYWSSMTWPAPWLKYLAGAALWTAVIGWLAFAGRTHHAAD